MKTGKNYTLFELFNSVFPDVRIIRYQDFIERPVDIYEKVAELGRFSFEDRRFADLKLNSLCNRLLIYNPIRVQLPPKPSRGLFVRNQPRLVRFRFEIADIIELCGDWGGYKRLEVDCSRHMTQVEDDLDATIGIGVCEGDLMHLEPELASMLIDSGFVQTMVDTIGPVFARNYASALATYRNEIYLNAVPRDALQAFLQCSGEDFGRMKRILEIERDRLV